MRLCSALVPLALTACGSVTPSMRYEAYAARERLPLAVAVRVHVAPVPSGSALGAGDEVLLATSLAASVEDELRAYGPYTPDPSADVRLVLSVDAYQVDAPDRTVYVATGLATLGVGFVLGPLVGLPIAGRDVEVTGRAMLVHTSGAVLAQAHGAAEAVAWTGLWYGRRVGLGGAASALVSDLLHKLEVQQLAVAQRLEQARTAPAWAVAPVVLAVLDVSGDALTPVLADQLTDYLATRLAARGAYRVVPRRAVQAELLAAKARTLEACVDEACQIELGKALAAEQTLTARVIQLDDACALTAALFDLRTETTARAASVRVPCAPSALLGGVDALVHQL